MISLSLHRNITGEDLDSASQAKKSAFKTPTSLGFSQVKEVLENYYKFTFVRDPFSRILSAYLQKIEQGKGTRKAKYKKMIRKRLGLNPNHEISFDDFIHYLDQGGIMDDPHWIPQSYYIDMLGHDKLHFVGRVENLIQDLHKLYCEILGNDNFFLPKYKKKETGSTNQLDKYYTRKSKKMIENLYVKDLEKFENANRI